MRGRTRGGVWGSRTLHNLLRIILEGRSSSAVGCWDVLERYLVVRKKGRKWKRLERAQPPIRLACKDAKLARSQRVSSSSLFGDFNNMLVLKTNAVRRLSLIIVYTDHRLPSNASH